MTNETEPAFRRSTFCGSGACVEVADTGTVMLIRDGKNPDGLAISFPAAAWDEFLAGAVAGEFTRPDPKVDHSHVV